LLVGDNSLYSCYLTIFTNLGVYIIDDALNCLPCKEQCQPEKLCQQKPITKYSFIYEDVENFERYSNISQKFTIKVKSNYREELHKNPKPLKNSNFEATFIC
jgi:hypothetical protein